MLLEQVYIANPEGFRKAVFPNSKKSEFIDCFPTIEFYYKNDRRADLALVHPEKGAIALVEIKEDDQNTPHATTQTQDYINYSKKNRILFAYISKHMLPAAVSTILKNNQINTIYYGDLYRSFYSESMDAVTGLFCDYLREERVAYQVITSEEMKALSLLIRQGNAMSRHLGVGRLNSASRIVLACELLPTIVNNMESLGNGFYRKYRKLFGNRFVPNFQFWPKFIVRKLRKLIADIEDADTFIDQDNIASGSIYIWSEGKIKSTENCYVWLGMCFRLQKSEQIKMTYYAGIGTGANFEEEESASFDTYPSEDKALQNLEKALVRQIKVLLKRDPRVPGHVRLNELMHGICEK